MRRLMTISTKSSGIIRGLAVGVLISTLTLTIINVTYAATIVVTTTEDELNSDGDCSLREAVQAANTNTAVDDCIAGSGYLDTITLGPGTYTLLLHGVEDSNMGGDLDILEDLIINGSNRANTIIELPPPEGGPYTDRVIDTFDVNFTASDLTIRQGHPQGAGGGILHRDNALELTNVNIHSNTGQACGGGVYISGSGPAVLTNVHIYDNHASCGGGIRSYGPLEIISSLIELNTSSGQGGGISIGWEEPYDTVIRNSTISGNDAGSHGGGLYIENPGVIELTNLTITENQADIDGSGGGFGGGIYIDGKVTNLTISNSLIADNMIAGSYYVNGVDCHRSSAAAFSSSGYNLQGVLSTSDNCDFSASGDMQGSTSSPLDPLIGPLSENGGPTRTHALLDGSPGIDMGSPLTPGSGGSSCSATDQRGWGRPIDGNSDGTATCDIGAYELHPTNVTKTETSTGPYGAGDTITYDIEVENTGNVTLTGVTASDPDTTLGACTPVQPSTLAPGVTMTCPASYVATQADVDAGSFTNVATGDSNETGPDTGSETVTIDLGVSNFVYLPLIISPGPPCPIPDLGVSTTRYAFDYGGHPPEVATILIFLTTGFSEEPPYECLTTGEELYLDSRIDLSIPGGDVVLSLPSDYIVQPANLEIQPLREDILTSEPYTYGDAFQGFEMDPDLSPILLVNPVLDGYAKLCNRDGECDDVIFTLTEGYIGE